MLHSDKIIRKAPRLPDWFRRPLPTSTQFSVTKKIVNELGLTTVCAGANCPNSRECHSLGTATFMILGDTCTRNCGFCNIGTAKPCPVEDDEPERVAIAAEKLQLKHVVITSVTRDDLADGGAIYFAKTITAVRSVLPKSSIEVLIPDFKGNLGALDIVIQANPDVINHNVETHGSLYQSVRPQANYKTSLELLANISRQGKIAKSGFMIGVGEDDPLVKTILEDLQQVNCSIVTIGQYLSPSLQHIPVDRYVEPERFKEYAAWGRDIGIPFVFSEPLMRSSYHAQEALERLLHKEFL